ncbi:hypothetical protein QE152_g8632 [Popillia japonica]|uniref:Endonuclease/exonuclease/phosphatase domain-containing protein n=1 Tax=Popillia japonica TaxID=7064 RepID=A0AAW1M3Y1_POPJA
MQSPIILYIILEENGVELSPSGDISVFLENLFTLLDEICVLGDVVVVAGDFNINLGENSSAARSLISILSCFKLIPYVTEPTRVTASSSTLIDNIFAEELPSTYSCSVGFSHVSDHKYQCLHMESLPQADVKKFYYRRSFSEENIARFQSALNSESWHGVFDDRDFNTQFQSFYDVLLYHFNLCFPLMKRPVRQSSSSPWYNNELRQMATELRELSTLCKNTSDKGILNLYKLKKDHYTKTIETTKKQFYNNLIVNSNNRSKASWSVIRSTSKSSHESRHISVHDDNGNLIGVPEEVVNLFGEHFNKPLANKNS